MQKSMVGKTIENYRIDGKLGEGAMGIVYKATDLNLDKEVALKMLKPELEKDSMFVKSFQREAKSIAKIDNDPNIVTIHNFLKSEHGSFLVMEYVDGITLADRIQQKGGLHWKEAFPLLKQILKSMGHAHRNEIIHRDIKPRNIMLTQENQVKITDFGLAKKQQEAAVATSTFAGAGTLYYMSPEQVRGAADVNHLTDIYAIGITFYETMTGKKPFDKTDNEFTTQQKIVEGKLPPPSIFNPNIPKELEKIILKAIHKTPAKRFQSADEMLAAIETFEHEQMPVPPSLKPAEKRSSKPNILKMATIAFSVLLIVFIAYIIFRQDGVSPPSPPPPDSTTISNKINIQEVVSEPTPTPELKSEILPDVPADSVMSINQAVTTGKLQVGDKLVRITVISDFTYWKPILDKLPKPADNLFWWGNETDEKYRIIYGGPLENELTANQLLSQYGISQLHSNITRVLVEQVNVDQQNQPVLTLDDILEVNN